MILELLSDIINHLVWWSPFSGNMSLHILRVSVWTEARQIVEQVAKLEMVNVQIKEKVNIEDDTSLNILLDKKLFYLIHCILD